MTCCASPTARSRSSRRARQTEHVTVPRRRTKIVATLGPATDAPGVLDELVASGMSCARLNCSHGTHDDLRRRAAEVRAASERAGRALGLLIDLQGPKLRVGTFAQGPHDLHDGQSFRFDLDPAPGDTARVQLPHPEIFAALDAGAELLVNDGKIRLRVERCGPDFADCVVTAGGPISNRKGVNVPDVVLPLAAPPRIELLTAQPGRGRGYVQLDIGTLRLTDALAAPALPALAHALARLPGVVVSHREDYDGW